MRRWGQELFDEVGRYLQAQGLTVSTGTIVDATIVAPPASHKERLEHQLPPVARMASTCYDGGALCRFCAYSASSARANNSSIEQGLVGSKRTTPTLKAKA